MRPSIATIQGDEFSENFVPDVVPADPGVLLLQASPVHRRAWEEFGHVSARRECYDYARMGIGVVFELEAGDGVGWDGVLGWEASDQAD